MWEVDISAWVDLSQQTVEQVETALFLRVQQIVLTHYKRDISFIVQSTTFYLCTTNLPKLYLQLSYYPELISTHENRFDV
jgi:hypothetical protein